MQLKHIWNHQMQFQVITQHEALLEALCHLQKTDNHNPQWQLNQNWEILQSINHNNNIHNMKCQLAQDNNPTHQFAINTAHTCILEYQAAHNVSGNATTNLGLWSCLPPTGEHYNQQEV
jgi:hypothetical protein